MTADPSALRADLAPAGELRVAINLGNPVLAQGTAAAPTGVTVDLACEFAARLGVPVRFSCVDAARDSFAALREGRVGLAFLAVEPARAAEVAFTAPYVLIEGVFAVPIDSPIITVDDVDRDGVRIGVKRGSAYDLFLTRTLAHAAVVAGDEGTAVFQGEGLEVAAGIRQPVTDFVARTPGLRVVDGPFMQIRQAIATGRDRAPETLRFLQDTVAELVGSGFVRSSLDRSGQSAATVAGA